MEAVCRYTISYVNVDCIDNVLNTLNSFHAHIFFTYEQECDGIISFSDVSTITKNNTIETTGYHKQADNDIYLGNILPENRGSVVF